MRHPALALCSLAVLLTAPQLHASPQESSHSLAALRIDEGVDLDGRLDEDFWAGADVASDFIQKEPDPGAPPSERTEIRVAYDHDTLYIGVMAFDSEPGRIIASELRRDGGGERSGFGGGASGAFSDDDSIVIVLDTFFDRRNAFYFETNPNGARADGLIEGEGRASFEWDGVWNAAARRSEQGWSAEIAIPFATLRFDPRVDRWGFNARRLIRRYNETSSWTLLGTDADVNRMSLAGTLTGIEGLEPGRNLRVKPFGIASNARSWDPDVASPGSEIDGGLDLLRWGVTDNMTLDVTANTDFAQVEADDQQVNLTRFSLFFPEKREFFLENAGIFSFGSGGGEGGGMRGPPIRVFHSRRIGLDGGTVVPLLLGTRFTGRTGGWNFGILNAQTDSVDADDPEDAVRSTNWGVARITRNLGGRSSVGAIFTSKQAGSDDWNRVVGIDADINPTREVNLNAFLVRSSDSVEGGGWAGGAGFGWRGTIWRATASVMEIQETFDPELGFLARGGIRRYQHNVDFEPRPENNLGVRNLSFNWRNDIVVDGEGDIETVDMSFRFFGFTLRSGDRVTFFAGYNFERLKEPFEIQDDIFIAPGEYPYWDFGVFVNTDGSRPVSLSSFVTKGDFYDGSRLMARSTLTFRLGKNFNASTAWSLNDVELSAGAFTTNLIQQRLNVALSPNLFWNTFVQYNDSAQLLTLNSRFNWIYKPGADLFLVYNQDWETGDGRMPANRAVILKFTYLLAL